MFFCVLYELLGLYDLLRFCCVFACLRLSVPDHTHPSAHLSVEDGDAEDGGGPSGRLCRLLAGQLQYTVLVHRVRRRALRVAGSVFRL